MIFERVILGIIIIVCTIVLYFIWKQIILLAVKILEVYDDTRNTCD